MDPTPTGSDGTQTICSGTTSNFDLTSKITNEVSSTFSWIAASNGNVTGESLSAQTGSLITDVLTNTTSTDQIVIYTVTPTSITGSCAGTSFTVSVTVAKVSVSIDESPS